MRRKLAHLLRRVARVMIGWSRRLDPPITPFDKNGYLDRARLAREGFVFVGAMTEDR